MIGPKTRGYIDGLLAMASAAAGGIGCSAMAAKYLPREGLAPALEREFDLDGPPELRPVEESLETVLCRWLGGWEEADVRDRRLVRELVWLLRRALGEPEALFEPAEGSPLPGCLGGGEGGCGPFYMVEELLLVQYGRGTLCLLLGNDE